MNNSEDSPANPTNIEAALAAEDYFGNAVANPPAPAATGSAGPGLRTVTNMPQ